MKKLPSIPRNQNLYKPQAILSKPFSLVRKFKIIFLQAYVLCKHLPSMMDLHIKKTMFQVINNDNIDVAPNGSSSFLAQSSSLSSISSIWGISSLSSNSAKVKKYKIKSQDTRSQDTRSQEHKIESDCSTISSLLRYGSNTSNSLPYSTA